MLPRPRESPRLRFDAASRCSPRSDGVGNSAHRMDGQPRRFLDGPSTDILDAPAKDLHRYGFGYPDFIGKCSKQFQTKAAREEDQWRRVDDCPISHGRVRDPDPRSLPETIPSPCGKVSAGNPCDPFPRCAPPTLARYAPADTIGQRQPVAIPCPVFPAHIGAASRPHPVVLFLPEPWSRHLLKRRSATDTFTISTGILADQFDSGRQSGQGVGTSPKPPRRAAAASPGGAGVPAMLPTSPPYELGRLVARAVRGR